MDCKKTNSLLIDFVDKKLNTEATKMVQSHLENCKKLSSGS